MTFIKTLQLTVRPVTTAYTSACCEVLIITYYGIKRYLLYPPLRMDFCDIIVYLHNVDNILSLIHWIPHSDIN